ncbi:MAG: AlpA family phage regulatory protein [Steroidobacteraceae bacterium]|nr:AlpA family phage regulatory protein [Steroidobacteraceae bacterium]
MRRTNSAQQQLTLAASSDGTTPARVDRATADASSPPIIILRLPDVCRVTGLCRSLVYELESNGTFPRRVPLGAHSVGWVESEVQSWLAARVKAREAGSAMRSARTADNRTIGPQARRAPGGTASPRAVS